jgi:hypothetical protein
VFHFIPETFAKAISATASIDTAFVSSRGRRRGNVNYAYADVVAGEILVGRSANTEEFFTLLGEAMKNTKHLVIRFTDNAERLIAQYLKGWGFTKE